MATCDLCAACGILLLLGTVAFGHGVSLTDLSPKTKWGVMICYETVATILLIYAICGALAAVKF